MATLKVLNLQKKTIGLRVGRLVALSVYSGPIKYDETGYVCQCDCGNTTILPGSRFRGGKAKSCGCLARDTARANGYAKAGKPLTHGATMGLVQTPTYKSWLTMRRRCFDVSFKDYPHYGGSGIQMQPDWEDFRIFHRDMGDRPPGMTLDRIDNTKGYSAINCRWATHTTQMNNTSRSRVLEYKGEFHTVSEWARILNVPRARLSARLNGLGWSIEKTLGEL